MEDLALSPNIRKAIYIVVVMGTAIIVPLDQLAMIPTYVSTIWSSVAGAASLLAAFNVTYRK